MPEIFTNSRISSKAVQNISDWYDEEIRTITSTHGEGTLPYTKATAELEESLCLGEFVFRDMNSLGRRYHLPKSVQIQIIRHMREYKYISQPQQKGNQENTIVLYEKLGLYPKNPNKDFQALCMDKVIKFITSTGRAILMSGGCSMVDGKPAWSEWTKAWDSEYWDGNIKFPPKNNQPESGSTSPSQQTVDSSNELPIPCDETKAPPSQLSSNNDSPKRARYFSPPRDSASSSGQLQVQSHELPQECIQARPQPVLEEFSEFLNWEASEQLPPAKRARVSSPAPLQPPPAASSSAPLPRPSAMPFVTPHHLEGLRITPFLKAHLTPNSNLTIDPRRLQV